MNLGLLLLESLGSVWREARRMAPMAAGIVWGVASVFVLVAVARGFETSQRAQLEALGDGFLLLRMNRATSTRGDPHSGAFVLLDGEDLEVARANSPSVASLSPKANNWFMQAYREHAITFATAQGVLPEYADICHVPLLPGSRWIDQNDLDNELPVAVIGPGVRQELFAEEPWQGQQIMLTFSRNGGEDTVVRRLTVVGALADEELASDEIYTSHRRIVFLPFTTWERFSPKGFQFFVMKPVTPDLRDAALAELRTAIGNRHGFDQANENTLLPYFDAIERGRQIDQVFGGMRLFLSSVGVLILLLGALGVANVVLMSVTARTFEFGLRRALGCKRRWIFGQVFVEASLVCLISGAAGFALGVLCVSVMSGMDLPEGFARPQSEWQAAFLPGLLLLVVSLGAATWPATRAARLSVAETLHGGKL